MVPTFCSRKVSRPSSGWAYFVNTNLYNVGVLSPWLRGAAGRTSVFDRQIFSALRSTYS